MLDRHLGHSIQNAKRNQRNHTPHIYQDHSSWHLFLAKKQNRKVIGIETDSVTGKGVDDFRAHLLRLGFGHMLGGGDGVGKTNRFSRGSGSRFQTGVRSFGLTSLTNLQGCKAPLITYK